VRPIEVPVLLIWGDRDPVFHKEMTEDFGEWVPDLRVAHIPEAGHFVQTDAAEQVNALLIDFLATPATARRSS
jgi:pimeloyl-ACP methyl ester carboxylesterase